MEFERIGIENHLNYIYKRNGSLSVEEAYGISGVLNSSIMDIFFRMLNGSTQVNAVDIFGGAEFEELFCGVGGTRYRHVPNPHRPRRLYYALRVYRNGEK